MLYVIKFRSEVSYNYSILPFIKANDFLNFNYCLWEIIMITNHREKIESKMTQRLCKTKSAVENLDILCNQSNIRLLASIKCKCLYAITRKNMSEINVNAFKLVTKMHYYASCACNHLHHIQSKTFQFPRKIRPTTKAKHTTISPVEEFSI